MPMSLGAKAAVTVQPETLRKVHELDWQACYQEDARSVCYWEDNALLSEEHAWGGHEDA